MSVVTVIAVIALVALSAALIVAWWHGRQHLFSVLFVAGIATLAIALSTASGRYSQNPRADRETTVKRPAAAGLARVPIGLQAGEQIATGATAPPVNEARYGGDP